MAVRGLGRGGKKSHPHNATSSISRHLLPLTNLFVSRKLSIAFDTMAGSASASGGGSNYLTPLSTVLFIFALCTAYMFLIMNGGTYNYVGDYQFILFKVLITISTVALGFVITITSVGWYYVAGSVLGGGSGINEYDFSTNAVVTTFLLYLSSIWMALAVAMLPFGHTVYAGQTNIVDEVRTQQLNAVQQAVYAVPYKTLSVLMALSLVGFVLMCIHHIRTMLHSDDGNGGGTGALFSTLFKAIRPTFGWYFRFDEGTWPKVAQQLTSVRDE